jgi:hypothetical protein
MCLKCRIQQINERAEEKLTISFLANSVKQEGNELKTDVACGENVCSTPFQW